MKTCPKCGAKLHDTARFCLSCGSEYREPATPAPRPEEEPAPKGDSPDNPLLGDKNLINESTIIGKQEKYEASNITINNTVTEDHSHTTVVCSISGKRIYMDHSVVCPECGKPVALEYYVEHSKRCERCEEKARDTFLKTAAGIASEGALDAARKARLDAEARRLRIDEATQREILRTVLKRTPSDSGRLSPVQEAELESAVKHLMRVDTPALQQQAMEALAVLHEHAENDRIDFWYFLALALIQPEQALRSYEEELADHYWQRYWGYLAYCILGSPKGSAAVDRLRLSFGERKDDILLAEAAYCMTRWFGSADQSMKSHAGELAAQIQPNRLSRPLAFIHATLRRVLDEGIRLDSQYDTEEIFTMIEIFRAGEYIEALQAREEELERRRQAERDRQERERQAAEEARRQRAEQRADERARRMEQEMARLHGDDKEPARGKAFAGYETTLPPEPKRKGGKRTLWIVIGILIAILIALFLIPAPESWQ